MHFRLWAIVAAVLASGLGIAANVIISPNMGMPVPIVGTDPGPDWANNINSSLSIIDSHDHTAGRGVPVPSAGLNINADLTFQGNNATNLRSTRFTAQGSPISGGSDLGVLYVSGVDLYYNDESGNQIRMTTGGNVNAGAGSITGLPSGTASASFAASTFTFQSATNTPAIMAVGPLVVGTNTASPHTVTVAPPGGLAANYNLTLPNVLPASTSVLTVDNSGNMAATTSPTLTGLTVNGNPYINGSVGIGTATPIHQLDIYNSGSDAVVTIRAPTATAAAVIAVESDEANAMSLIGNGSSNSAYGGTGSLNIYQGNNKPIAFITNNVSTPRMIVTGGGNVGIATISPSQPLEVNGNALFDETVTIQSTTTINGTTTVNGAATINGTGGNIAHACVRRASSPVNSNPATIACSAGEIAVGTGATSDTLNGIARLIPASDLSAVSCWWSATPTNGTCYAICCSI